MVRCRAGERELSDSVVARGERLFCGWAGAAEHPAGTGRAWRDAAEAELRRTLFDLNRS
jgi:hypothetical protein